MPDRPILFSAPMVQALLAGTKIQTRRAIKARNEMSLFHPGQWADRYVLDPGNAEWRAREVRFAVGDRLWVKETHAYVGTGDPGFLIYRATYHECCAKYGFDHTPAQSEVTWKPSIFMRRALSRLTLTVTDLRVERLQDISDADAIAEGATQTSVASLPGYPDQPAFHHGQKLDPTYEGFISAKASYRHLWDTINGKGSWDANPWVVAVSFDVREGNIDG